MSITSDEILAEHSTNDKIVSSPAGSSETKANRDYMFALETAYLKKNPMCPLPQLEDLQHRLSGLNPEKLGNFVAHDFYNQDVMRAATCITDSIIYTSPHDISQITTAERIRHWFHDLKQIGSPSSSGVAMKANLTQDQIKIARDFAVLKAPREEFANQELIHELFVGFYGTNWLRQTIPNFAIVLGGFKCSPPMISHDTKEAYGWCSAGKETNFTIYENINPSVSMYEFVKTCTLDEFLEIFLQLLLALKKAAQEIGFTHYDLHTENIMIRKLDRRRSIKYDEGYISSQYIATIIDYGRSRILVGNKSFGAYESLSFFVYPHRAFIFHDVYKMLIYSLGTINKYNQKIASTTKLNELVKFFNQTETFNEIYTKQAEIAYSLPYTEVTRKYQMKDFLAFLHQTINIKHILSDRPADQLLDHHHFDFTEVLDQVGLTGSGQPQSTFDFLEQGTRLQNDIEADETAFQQLVVNFRPQYDLIRDTETAAWQSDGETLVNTPVTVTRIMGETPETIFTEAWVEKYRRFVTMVVRLSDRWHAFDLKYQSLQYAAENCRGNDLIYLDTLRDMYNKTQREIHGRLKEYCEMIRQDEDQLENLIKQQKSLRNMDQKRAKPRNNWTMLLLKYPKIRWYIDGLALFNYIWK